MNNTQESSDGPRRTEAIGAYSYSIGISFGILLLLIIISYSYYVYTQFRGERNQQNHTRSGTNAMDTNSSINYEGHCSQGLDEDTIVNCPKVLYSQVKSEDCSASGCSICLQDYKDIDLLRQLPECGHFFHFKCVDPWLRLHPTCPVCRNSPLPTPSATPVVEVVPLAAQHRENS